MALKTWHIRCEGPCLNLEIYTLEIITTSMLTHLRNVEFNTTTAVNGKIQQLICHKISILVH